MSAEPEQSESRARDNVPKILSPGEEVLKILESFTQTLAFDSSRSGSSSSAWSVASGKAREIRDKDTRISVKVCRRKEGTQMTANPHGNEHEKSKQKSSRSRSSRRERSQRGDDDRQNACSRLQH